MPSLTNIDIVTDGWYATRGDIDIVTVLDTEQSSLFVIYINLTSITSSVRDQTP